MKHKYIYPIDIYPQIVKKYITNVLQNLHLPTMRPKGRPDNLQLIYIHLMLAVYIQYKMYIPPPQYQTTHIAHLSLEQHSLYLCVCVFVFLYLHVCQLSLGTFSFFVCRAGKMGQKEPKMKYKYIYAYMQIHICN